jgi:hypothetical protein
MRAICIQFNIVKRDLMHLHVQHQLPGLLLQLLLRLHTSTCMPKLNAQTTSVD